MKRPVECFGIALCLATAGCTSPPPRDEARNTATRKPDVASQAKAQTDAGAIAQGGGKRETLSCYTGSEDRHARIGIELVNDRVDYFAFYSKSRPRTCSIAAGRSEAGSRWSSDGASDTVTLPAHRGQLRIERKSGAYRFAFIDVDRVRYCGMSGKINGSLTVTRGSGTCTVQGIMDGHSS